MNLMLNGEPLKTKFGNVKIYNGTSINPEKLLNWFIKNYPLQIIRLPKNGGNL